MKKIYAPWRQKYSEKVDKKKQDDIDEKECPFCIQLDDNADEKHFILHRAKHNYVMMNLYPYNAGHLMVIPYKHKANLAQLTPEERHELIDLATTSITILEQILQSQGINVGFNLGKDAGAGIPSHLHMHIIPRWRGDTNFMPLIADTKHISFDLHEIYKKLKPAFDAA